MAYSAVAHISVVWATCRSFWKHPILKPSHCKTAEPIDANFARLTHQAFRI
jgi:hypothetical protein